MRVRGEGELCAEVAVKLVVEVGDVCGKIMRGVEMVLMVKLY